MKQKIFYDQASGRVLCSYAGTDDFLESQVAPENSLCAYVNEDQLVTSDWLYSSGQLSYSPRVLEKGYAALRQEAYPAIGVQLDMFWHAMNDGQIPKIEPFYSEIKAIKEKYPKPSSGS